MFALFVVAGASFDDGAAAATVRDDVEFVAAAGGMGVMRTVTDEGRTVELASGITVEARAVEFNETGAL